MTSELLCHLLLPCIQPVYKPKNFDTRCSFIKSILSSAILYPRETELDVRENVHCTLC
jgi:hypothetical protein